MPLDFSKSAEAVLDFSADAEPLEKPEFRDLSADQPLRLLSPQPVPSGERMTTYGGPRKPLATYAETMSEPSGESLLAPRIRFTEPRVTLPAIPIDPKEDWKLAAVKEIGNSAKAVPEFFTSDAGVLSVLSAKLSPRLTSAGFSADLTHSAFQQAKQAYRNWHQMTGAQKSVAVVDTLATLLFGGMAGAHAAGVKLPTAQPKPQFQAPLATGEVLRTPEGAKPPPQTEIVIQAEPPEAKVEEPAIVAPSAPPVTPEKPYIVAGKLTPDGEIIVARDHRAFEQEGAQGQSGYVVVPPTVDEMMFERDLVTLSPEAAKKQGIQFVSISEAQAAKGDIELAAKQKSAAKPEAVAEIAPPVAPKAKEPWEMTLGEKAIQAGEKVPKNILDAYKSAEEPAPEPAKPPLSEPGKAEAVTPPPTAVAGEEGQPGTVTAAPWRMTREDFAKQPEPNYPETYKIELDAVANGLKPAHYGFYPTDQPWSKEVYSLAKQLGLYIKKGPRKNDYIITPDTESGRSRANTIYTHANDAVRNPALEDDVLWHDRFGKLLGYGREFEGRIVAISGPKPLENKRLHRYYVAKAVREGKPVAPEVLADYPDLAKPTPPQAPGKAGETGQGAAGGEKAKPVPVWKVSYVDLEARNSHRPFFNQTALSAANTRKEAIERVQAMFGAPKYGEFRASKAPAGTKADYHFEAPKAEPPPVPVAAPPTPQPAAAKVAAPAAKVEAEVKRPVETVAKQQSGFDTKQAKAQKKFLLDEIDKAISEAPDTATGEWQNEGLKGEWVEAQNALEGQPRSFDYYNKPKEELDAANSQWEQAQTAKFSGLFQKYGIPEIAPTSTPFRNVVGEVESYKKGGPYTFSERIGLLREAISKANYELSPKVTIEVPGDGVFSILNTKTALAEFKDRAASFPTSAPRQPKPSTPRPTASSPAALGELNKESAVRAAGLYVSDDPGRLVIGNIWSDGKQTVATDGRRLIVIRKGIGGTEKKPLIQTPEGKKWTEKQAFPNWRQVIPEKSTEIFKDLDAARLFTILRQAKEATSERSKSIKICRNPDGSIGVSANAPDVAEYNHNIKEGARVVTAVNPDYMIDAVNAARILGDEKVSISATFESRPSVHKNPVTGLSPIIIRSKNADTVLMPMRLESGGPEAWALTKKDLAQKPTTPEAIGGEPGPGAQGSLATPPIAPTGGAVAPANVPVKAISQIIRDLSKGLNVPVRFGRLTTTKFAGYFKAIPNLIGSKKANDLPVVSHEIGHKLDGTLKISSDPTLAAELDLLGDPARLGPGSSWTPGKPRAYKMGEGVAEFVRQWIDDPVAVARHSPNLSRYFEDLMNTHLDLGRVLRQAQEDVRLWKTAPALARLDSSIVKGQGPVKARYTISNLTRDLVDDLHFLRLASEEAGGAKGLPASRNPYVLARLLRGTFGMADTFAQKGIVDFATKAVRPGTGLEQILKPVSGRLNDFRRFIVAKRAKELQGQGRETGLVPSDVDEAIRTYQGEPEFQATFDKLKAWNDSLLQYALDAGMLTKETVAAMREMNQDYVPFHRLFEIGANELSAESGLGTGRGLNAGTPGSLKRLKGSARDIVDPLETMVRNAYAIVTASEKNAISVALSDLARLPNMGKWVERIRTPIDPHKVTMGDLRKRLEGMGADVSMIPDDAEFAFFRKSGRTPYGENIIKVVKNGRSEYFRINGDLYETFQALDYDLGSRFIRYFSAPSQVLRAGRAG